MDEKIQDLLNESQENLDDQKYLDLKINLEAALELVSTMIWKGWKNANTSNGRTV